MRNMKQGPLTKIDKTLAMNLDGQYLKLDWNASRLLSGARLLQITECL
jgi:hypothetical protein